MTADQELDRVVAWLRQEGERCDCSARDDSECGCGAFGTKPGELGFKRVYIADIIGALTDHEHRSEADG